ncbi:glycosyltransferase family 2 protein [Methanocaldococcus sp.]|uniref:glycosyltransferase family 2 protein n=1 Tax=Methanocaldococcus sp. TaxID=2152917 RepID=UPI0026097C04|nr:glycosyltransferase family 2 protein [Methanocaldococcus sp.]MCQ6254492.1 glycosyltransferase family 2 protein [Methanocaldococcus sp.]
MDKNPLVSVVIPTHNRKKQVERLINSILENTYKNIEIIVVDDASTDGTYEYIKKNFDDLTNLKIVRNDKNLLLAGSRNKGINLSKGELIFLVDDDNVLDTKCIENLVKVIISDNKIGMVGPIMYYWKDKKRIWWAGTKRNMLTSRTYFIGRDLPLPNEDVWETDDFPNAFMVKREVVEKVGIFDEKTFAIQYDEADFGMRVRQKGYKCLVVKNAIIYHDMSLPEEMDKDRQFHIYDEKRAYYMGRNRIIFHKKYSKWWQCLIFILVYNWLVTGYYLKVILFESKKPFRERLKIAKVYLKGVVEGMKWTNSY